MATIEGHVTLHVIVENQLALGDPPQARAALARLRAAGLGRHEAVHAIASVLVRHLHGVVQGANPDDAYQSELDSLTAEKWR